MSLRPDWLERTQRSSIYGKEQRVGVSVFLPSDCIGCSHRTASRRLPFPPGQILVSVMHCCSPTIYLDNLLYRITIWSRLASSLIFGHISALIGPHAWVVSSRLKDPADWKILSCAYYVIPVVSSSCRGCCPARCLTEPLQMRSLCSLWRFNDNDWDLNRLPYDDAAVSIQ